MSKPHGRASRGTSSGSAAVLLSLVVTAIPQWSYIFGLIFGGCCSNAWTLELSMSAVPNLGTLITLLHFSSTALLALPHQFEKKPAGNGWRWRRNRVPMHRWGFQVLLYASSSLLNNVAFRYDVPMTIHIIFRSGGLVVNMLVGWLLKGKRYSLGQVGSVFLVTAGVIIATFSTTPAPKAATQGLADGQPMSKYFAGILMLFLALILSAIMGLWQEITFERFGAEHWRESLFYSHVLSLPLLAMRATALKEEWTLASNSEPAWVGFGSPPKDLLIPGGVLDLSLPLRLLIPSPLLFPTWLVGKGFTVPFLYPLLFLNTITQLACINGVNRLTSLVSAVTVTLILVVRKAVSLAISVFVVGGGKGTTGQGWLAVGAIAVGIGTLGYAWTSNQQNKRRVNDNIVEDQGQGDKTTSQSGSTLFKDSDEGKAEKVNGESSPTNNSSSAISTAVADHAAPAASNGSAATTATTTATATATAGKPPMLRQNSRHRTTGSVGWLS